jgi:hypothetical protein
MEIARLPQWVFFDQVIELSLRADVRFDPESDQDRAVRRNMSRKGQSGHRVGGCPYLCARRGRPKLTTGKLCDAGVQCKTALEILAAAAASSSERSVAE